MGRILFVTWDGGGNVPPVLALADRLRARGHEVRAHGHGVPRRDASSPAGLPYLARDLLAEWDQSALAREVRVEAGTADVVVADYMLPGALCGAEASFRPSVALVHTLYAANLDDDGGLLPMQMAATVDGLAAVRAELSPAAGRQLRSRSSTARPRCSSPARRPSTPRAARRPTCGTWAPCWRRPGPTPGGARQESTTAARSSSSASARRRWTRVPCSNGC